MTSVAAAATEAVMPTSRSVRSLARRRGREGILSTAPLRTFTTSTMPQNVSEGQISVLLVDDHALFRRGLRELLTDHGFDVLGEASDGASGARLAGELRPDVVLMDLEMPGVDGREAIRRIVEARVPTRVLVLT